MEKNIQGLHHITVLASDPQRNHDFYTKIMGLRFVKKTVNFDAPDVYHFYFGDETGTPGTVLTFFPFPHAPLTFGFRMLPTHLLATAPLALSLGRLPAA